MNLGLNSLPALKKPYRRCIAFVFFVTSFRAGFNEQNLRPYELLSGRGLNSMDQKKFPPIDERVRIGHVHLKVSDLHRALDFYCGILGFRLTQRYGAQAAFVSAGGYHHHIGLNTWESAGGTPPPAGATGLYHIAILYPTRAALAEALRRVLDAGIALEGASDHGVSEALYLRDPDDNGIELYWDRPAEEWPRAPDGSLAMTTRRLDLEDLLGELPR
jgi:catechol 2,3-dioxygenase